MKQDISNITNVNNPTDKKKRDQERMYAAEENPWKVTAFELGVQKNIAEFIKSKVGCPKLILEFGSGEGRASESYKAVLTESEFIGFDISETASDRARKRRLNSIALDVENISSSLKELVSKADMFMAIEMLYYLDDYKTFLKFLHDNCKKGALFCIGDSLVRFNYREYLHRNFEDIKLIDKFHIFNHKQIISSGKSVNRTKKIFLSEKI